MTVAPRGSPEVESLEMPDMAAVFFQEAIVVVVSFCIAADEHFRLRARLNGVFNGLNHNQIDNQHSGNAGGGPDAEVETGYLNCRIPIQTTVVDDQIRHFKQALARTVT